MSIHRYLKPFASSTNTNAPQSVAGVGGEIPSSSTTLTRKSRTSQTANMAPKASSRQLSRKRTFSNKDQEFKPSSATLGERKRSTTKERSAADPHEPVNKLVDSLRPGLMLVTIGLNPGLMTAATGHAYGHPSNHYWRLMHSSGITPKLHHPSETHDLPDLYSIGNTNICARATRSGDGLTMDEQIEGAGILEEKIALFKPEAVCIVGKGIWEVIYKTKTGRKLKNVDFKYGWQKEELWLGRTVDDSGLVEWAGAKTFVATTTSALAATMKTPEKLAIWEPLGQWVKQRREEMAIKKTEGDGIEKETS